MITAIYLYHIFRYIVFIGFAISISIVLPIHTKEEEERSTDTKNKFLFLNRAASLEDDERENSV